MVAGRGLAFQFCYLLPCDAGQTTVFRACFHADKVRFMVLKMLLGNWMKIGDDTPLPFPYILFSKGLLCTRHAKSKLHKVRSKNT